MRNLCLATLGTLLLVCACKPGEPTTATTDTSATLTATATTDTTPTAAPAPQEFTLDHYKIWRVKTLEAKGSVFLRGQFDTAEWEAGLVSVQFIGNPTDKTDVEQKIEVKIKNDALHYLVYAIRAKAQPSREVFVTNQFAKEEPWKITQPQWLLVPAAKKVLAAGEKGAAPEAAAQGDHFVCYATEGKRFEKALLLADQFDRLKGPNDVEKIRALQAISFCVPVVKRAGAQTFDIRDRETHLAIYKIDPPEQVSISAWARDQFGAWQLSVTNSELLAVPSHKRYEPPK